MFHGKLHATPAIRTRNYLTNGLSTCLTLRRCSNAPMGAVRPSREHHERWVIQQLSECREAFDRRTAFFQSFASSDVSSPGNYNIMQHAEYMISSLRLRHPGLRMASFFGSRMSLEVDRDDIVNSTVRATLHLHTDIQPQCNSNDAGCSSGCHP